MPEVLVLLLFRRFELGDSASEAAKDGAWSVDVLEAVDSLRLSPFPASEATGTSGFSSSMLLK